jgi:hypothetical protein
MEYSRFGIGITPSFHAAQPSLHHSTSPVAIAHAVCIFQDVHELARAPAKWARIGLDKFARAGQYRGK